MRYQILTKYKNGAWEHCDYAEGSQELEYLLREYKMAYGSDFQFKTVVVKGD